MALEKSCGIKFVSNDDENNDKNLFEPTAAAADNFIINWLDWPSMTQAVKKVSHYDDDSLETIFHNRLSHEIYL